MPWGLLRTVSMPHLHCRTLAHCSWHFALRSGGFKISIDLERGGWGSGRGRVIPVPSLILSPPYRRFMTSGQDVNHSAELWALPALSLDSPQPVSLEPIVGSQKGPATLGFCKEGAAAFYRLPGVSTWVLTTVPAWRFPRCGLLTVWPL